MVRTATEVDVEGAQIRPARYSTLAQRRSSVLGDAGRQCDSVRPSYGRPNDAGDVDPSTVWCPLVAVDAVALDHRPDHIVWADFEFSWPMMVFGQSPPQIKVAMSWFEGGEPHEVSQTIAL